MEEEGGSRQRCATRKDWGKPRDHLYSTSVAVSAAGQHRYNHRHLRPEQKEGRPQLQPAARGPALMNGLHIAGSWWKPLRGDPHRGGWVISLQSQGRWLRESTEHPCSLEEVGSLKEDTLALPECRPYVGSRVACSLACTGRFGNSLKHSHELRKEGDRQGSRWCVELEPTENISGDFLGKAYLSMQSRWKKENRRLFSHRQMRGTDLICKPSQDFPAKLT